MNLLDAPGARSLIACPREVGSECPHCAVEIVLGDPIMVCQACGTVHHRVVLEGTRALRLVFLRRRGACHCNGRPLSRS